MVRKTDFLDIQFDYDPPGAVIENLCTLAKSDDFHYIVTPNVDHIIHLARGQGSGTLNSAYEKATMRVCDSRILALIARLYGYRIPTFPGSDITAELFHHHLRTGQRVLIVGGSEQIFAAVCQKFPGPDYHHCIPPMGLRHDKAAQDEVIEAVETAQPDFTFFAVGSPQSEIIAERIFERGQARGVALCIGASIEFITGFKKRAPRWVQRLRLEWLHRLLSEPRRLWRRYLIEGPKIFVICAKWYLSRNRHAVP